MDINAAELFLTTLRRPEPVRVWAHDANEFLKALVREVGVRVYDAGPPVATPSIWGVPILTVGYLQPGVALVLDSHSSIVKVIRYRDA